MRRDKNLQIRAWVVATLACLALFSCGEPLTYGPALLSGLPAATDAINTNLTAPIANADGSPYTGVPLSGSGASALAGINWTGNSRALCESAAAVRNLLAGISVADRNTCYVGVLDQYGFFSTPYDSIFYVHLENLPTSISGSTDGYLKILASKTGSVVSSLTLYSCLNPGPAQDSFAGLSIGGALVLKFSATNTSNTSGTGQSFAVTTGSVNNSSEWLTKTINAATTFTSSGGSPFSFTQFATLVQVPLSLSIQSYNTLTSGTQTSQIQVAAQMDLLDPTPPSAWSVGNGSGNVDATVSAAGTLTPFSSLDSWLSDTHALQTPDTDGSYFNVVNAMTLPAFGTPTIGIQNYQAWDCTAPSFTVVDFNQVLANPAASAAWNACTTDYTLDQSVLPQCWNGQ